MIRKTDVISIWEPNLNKITILHKLLEYNPQTFLVAFSSKPTCDQHFHRLKKFINFFVKIRATVIVVNKLCWWQRYVTDFMLLTIQKCHFLKCKGSVTYISNRPRISQSCHQHKLSPTSITNIDVVKIRVYRGDTFY